MIFIHFTAATVNIAFYTGIALFSGFLLKCCSHRKPLINAPLLSVLAVTPFNALIYYFIQFNQF